MADTLKNANMDGDIDFTASSGASEPEFPDTDIPQAETDSGSEPAAGETEKPSVDVEKPAPEAEKPKEEKE